MKKNIILLFFGLIVLIPGFSVFPQEGQLEKKLSLPFLMERGELRYPEVKRKQHELAGARAQEKDAFWRRFPDINMTFNFNYFPYVYKQDRGEGTSYYFDQMWDKPGSPFINPSLNFTLPLYTFGKISSGEKAAQAQVEMKKAEIEEAVGSVRFNIKRLYWSFLYAESLIKYVIDITLPEYEKLLGDQEKNFKEGKATRAALERTRISFYDLKRNQAEAEQSFAEISQWIRLLGDLQGDAPIKLELERLSPLSLKIESYEYYLNLFRSHNPGLKKSRYGYDARTHYYDYQKANFYPDLYLAGSINYLYHRFSNEADSRDGYGIKEPVFGATGVSFGLVFGLRWNLSFWKGLTQTEMYEAAYLADLEQIKMAETYQETELKKSYENLMKRQKILKASEEQFKAARRWTIFSMNAYKAKTGSLDDAQNGVITLFHRKRDYYSSVYEYNLALAAFENQLGLDLLNYSHLSISSGEPDDEE